MYSEPMDGIEPAGFKIHLPPREAIQWVHRRLDGVPVPSKDLVDVAARIGTATNTSIIILQSYAQKIDVAQTVSVFTGDSASYRINPAIGPHTPHLAIYKIQQHGAYNSSVHGPGQRSWAM